MCYFKDTLIKGPDDFFFYDSSIIFYNKRLLCFPATKGGIINNKIEVSFIYHFTTLGLQKENECESLYATLQQIKNKTKQLIEWTVE